MNHHLSFAAFLTICFIIIYKGLRTNKLTALVRSFVKYKLFSYCPSLKSLGDYRFVKLSDFKYLGRLYRDIKFIYGGGSDNGKSIIIEHSSFPQSGEIEEIVFPSGNHSIYFDECILPAVFCKSFDTPNYHVVMKKIVNNENLTTVTAGTERFYDE